MAVQTLASAAGTLAIHSAEMSAALDDAIAQAQHDAIELAATIGRKLALHLMAMQGGAKVAHTPSVEIALAALRAGRGADLLLIDVVMDIAGLSAGLEAERIAIPVVACGVEANAAAAVNAIRAGAKEYIPVPPDAELVAAVIAAIARDSADFLSDAAQQA